MILSCKILLFNYYDPVDETRKLAKERTITPRNKNKVRYDARYLQENF